MRIPSRTAACLFAVGIACLRAIGCGGAVAGGRGAPTEDGGGDSTTGDGSGASSSGSSGGASSSGSGSGSGGSAESGVPCINLQCQVPTCPHGGDTTLTGTVLDPAGRNPVYDVGVYVPNSPGGQLDPLPSGVGASACDCASLFTGQPMVTAVTDLAGSFTLRGVPAGTNIPLVVQTGKWRKEITVPSIEPCTSNAAGTIDLPKSPTDGAYASIPNIAVSTGLADSLECTLARMGVDESAFLGGKTGTGVHVFQGAGGNAAQGSLSSPAALWDSTADLLLYDLVVLSCEGSPTTGVTAQTASDLAAYLDAGGRVFSEHYHYAFFTSYGSTSPVGTPYPEFAGVADWDEVGPSGNDQPYNADIGCVIEPTLQDGQPFPQGIALEAWLGQVGALDASGELVVPLANARDNALVGPSNLAIPWMQTDPAVTPPSTQLFSWDMPLSPADAGPTATCGRVVYSDTHASGSPSDYATSTVVPTGCDATAPLSPDEDAIEFMLFNLTSCIEPVAGFPPPGADAGP